MPSTCHFSVSIHVARRIGLAISYPHGGADHRPCRGGAKHTKTRLQSSSEQAKLERHGYFETKRSVTGGCGFSFIFLPIIAKFPPLDVLYKKEPASQNANNQQSYVYNVRERRIPNV